LADTVEKLDKNGGLFFCRKPKYTKLLTALTPLISVNRESVDLTVSRQFRESVIKLQTERLLIRDHTNLDLDAMYRWISDPIVMEYLDWGTNSIAETAIKLNEAIEEIKKKEKNTSLP